VLSDVPGDTGENVVCSVGAGKGLFDAIASVGERVRSAMWNLIGNRKSRVEKSQRSRRMREKGCGNCLSPYVLHHKYPDLPLTESASGGLIIALVALMFRMKPPVLWPGDVTDIARKPAGYLSQSVAFVIQTLQK